MKRTRIALFLILFPALCGLVLAFAGNTSPALAAGASPTPTLAPTNTPSPTSSSHISGHAETDDCLLCHSNPSMTGKFANGETVSLYYDPAKHANSVHIAHGLGCKSCHTDISGYPHPQSPQTSCANCHASIAGGGAAVPGAARPVFDITAQDARAFTLQMAQVCQKCHQEQAHEIVDSAHTRIMARGNRYAPVCIDCHSSHDVPALTSQPRSEIPKICARCHLAVYTSYEGSVHGAALESTNNPDVPTCVDCHGVHEVQGPDEGNFRADSIQVCGNCHSDKTRMSKYGISTDVLNTYLDDFHGRTVDFFRQSKTVNVTKATCYDCHGIHDILPPDNKASSVYPTNLQKTCQQCHPSADIKFPQAWLSHYVPTWDKTPVLFAVNTGYQIFIPTLIGGFLIYIGLDARRRIAARLKKFFSKK